MATWEQIIRFAGEVAAETLWPTHCALCDAPGAVLCDACAAALPVLDWWKACPRCGSAYGKVQCDLCNPVSMARIGRDHLPFSGCASATVFDEDTTGRLVRVYKDRGEQRLARELACRMAPMIAPGWNADALAFVPATKAAVRHRGFDHAELLARQVATCAGLPCVPALERPRTRDQRTLTGNERIRNLGGSFTARGRDVAGRRVVLVDDVFTTGSTMCAACDALLEAGAEHVFALTFARV